MPPKKENAKGEKSQSESTGKNWEKPETLFLISLYAEHYAELESLKKKTPIWEKIAAELKPVAEVNKWRIRDHKSISKKISNLRYEYTHDYKPKSTGDEAPTWDYYAPLHQIWHGRPALNPDAAKTSEIGLKKEITVVLEEQDDDEVQAVLYVDNESAINEGTNRSTEEPTAMEKSLPVTQESTTPPMREEQRSRKRSKANEEIVRLCSETFEFIKEQSEKREKDREEMKATNLAIITVLNRMADSSETIAKTMQKGPKKPKKVLGENNSV